MNVRFLTGRFVTYVNHAGNDFESMSVGPVTALTGSTNVGNMSMTDADSHFIGTPLNHSGNDMEGLTIGAIETFTGSTNSGDTSFGTGRFVVYA